MELPKPVSNPHLLSKCVHEAKPPTSNVPGDCAAAVPPRSKAVIAQTVQLLLNMIGSSEKVEILLQRLPRLHVALLRQDACPVNAIALFRPSPLDRKSTRLNSSHSSISYAVFCLKKK